MLGTACAEDGHELFNAAGPIRCSAGAWAVITWASDSVASRAYRYVIARYWSNPQSKLKLEIVSDTETIYATGVVARQLRAADRFWSVTVAAQPLPVIIAHNSQSLSDLADARKLPFDEVAIQEDAPRGCGQANYVGNDVRPWLLFCFGAAPDQTSASHRAFGNVGAHEFTHLAQDMLSKDRLGRHMCLRSAPWFEEGLASYMMAALGAVGGAEGDLRTAWLSGLASTTADLAAFNFANPSESHETYAIGMFATEALYALQGDAIVDRLLQSCATGLKFSDAFESVTGHDLDEWTSVLNAYVASVRVGSPLTLTDLTALKRQAFAA